MMPAVEWVTKNFERVTPGVLNAKDKFGTDDSRRSNGRRKLVRVERMVINGSAAKCGRS